MFLRWWWRRHGASYLWAILLLLSYTIYVLFVR